MEKKDNTMTIIIVIIVVIIIALAGYFIMTGTQNKQDQKAPNVNDNTEIDNTDRNDETAVAGSYSGSLSKDESLVEDAKDAVTGEDDAEGTIELYLDNDGTAQIAINEDVIDGTYTVDSKKITVVKNNTNTNAGTTNNTDNNETKNTTTAATYEFTINDDDTLEYNDNDQKATLKKTTKTNLKYIK